MKIIHLRQSWCSGAPATLSRTLNNIPGVISRVVIVPRERECERSEYNLHVVQLIHDITTEYKPDIVHWHQCFDLNIYQQTKKIKHIVHYHGAPEMEIAIETAHGNNLPPGVKSLVCAHYHPGCEAYYKCTPIRNITTLPKQPPELLNKSKLENQIQFVSSFTNDINKSIWQKKGAIEMSVVMELLELRTQKEIVYTQARGLPHTEVMQLKAEHDIVVDECVTPGFHLSSIEGLSLGKPVICWVDDKVSDIIKRITGADKHPFHGSWIGWLVDFLNGYIKDVEEIVHHGNESYEWFVKYWNPNDIIQDYITIYNE